MDVRFLALFEGEANLRTTEVAAILSIHRTTISRYKSYGIGDCEELTLRQLVALVDIISMALVGGDLPLANRDITGKKARLSALRTILRKYQHRVLEKQ